MLRERLGNALRRELVEDLEKIVRELIERYRPVSIIIAGSLARGEFVEGLSDIDILVVIEGDPGKDRFLLRAVGDVDVEITVVGLRELLEAIERGNEFYLQALRGIEVYGDLRERLGSEYSDSKDSEPRHFVGSPRTSRC